MERIETERLILRELAPGDLPRLIEIRSAPEVYQYLGGLKMQNPESIKKRMKVYIDSYDIYGFGAGAMIWKKTGEMFGWSGLMKLEDLDEVEVGYGMTKEFWRKGIGLECASAWLDFGFKKIGLERIVALAVPENVGSWRIMEKLGMSYEKNVDHHGMDCKFYAISKDEFLKNS